MSNPDKPGINGTPFTVTMDQRWFEEANPFPIMTEEQAKQLAATFEEMKPKEPLTGVVYVYGSPGESDYTFNLNNAFIDGNLERWGLDT